MIPATPAETLAPSDAAAKGLLSAYALGEHLWAHTPMRENVSAVS